VTTNKVDRSMSVEPIARREFLRPSPRVVLGATMLGSSASAVHAACASTGSASITSSDQFCAFLSPFALTIDTVGCASSSLADIGHPDRWRHWPSVTNHAVPLAAEPQRDCANTLVPAL